jgi:hypothetical protein
MPTKPLIALRKLGNWCGLPLSAILLSSCATTGSSVPTDRVACRSFEPIYWSGKDTPKTIAQVKEHNAAGKAVCGWGQK